MQNDVAKASDHASEEIELQRVIPFRTTVRQDEKRIVLPCFVIRGKCEKAFEFCAVLGDPVHDADFAESDFGESVIAFVSDFLKFGATGDGDILGVVWIADREGEHL